MATTSESSADSVLLGNMATLSEGSEDSVLLKNMTIQSESSADSVLLDKMTTQIEGSTDSVLLENMPTQIEGSTDSVLLENMANKSESSSDSVFLENMTTQSEDSSDSVFLENMTTQGENTSDCVSLENTTTQGEVSCIRNDSSDPKSVQILILGEVGIGKTTLIKSYLSAMNVDVEEIDIDQLDDIFSIYPLRMNYNEKVIGLGLIDLDPGANSPERRQCYPIGVNVIILCFSIGHYSTLKSVYNLWIHEVRSHFGKSTPVFLVGLKSDVRLIKPGTLGAYMFCQEGDRTVEISEAEVIHKNYQFHGDYMECSESDTDSVIHVIQQAFQVAIENLISV